jgi:hypothetical protein
MYQVVRYMLRRGTRTHARTHARAFTRARACAFTRACARAFTRARTHVHSRAHAHAHSHAHARTHADRPPTAGAHCGRPPRGPDQRAALDDRLCACECGRQRTPRFLPPAPAASSTQSTPGGRECLGLPWTARAAKPKRTVRAPAGATVPLWCQGKLIEHDTHDTRTHARTHNTHARTHTQHARARAHTHTVRAH